MTLMMLVAAVVCLVAPALALPRPQGLTLSEFNQEGRPADRLRSLDTPFVFYSSPYRSVRRQGRRGDTSNIKFPTLTVKDPNVFTNNREKVAEELARPVFRNDLPRNDIAEKLEEINKEEEERIKEQELERDLELLVDIDMLEKIVVAEEEVKEEIAEDLAEEVIEEIIEELTPNDIEIPIVVEEDLELANSVAPSDDQGGPTLEEMVNLRTVDVEGQFVNAEDNNSIDEVESVEESSGAGGSPSEGNVGLEGNDFGFIQEV